MKTITPFLLAATVIAGSATLAAPAFAIPPGGTTGVLTCNTGSDASDINQSKQQLALMLHLSNKQAPTIDDWGGCLKVQYTDNHGHDVVALYDPDSLSLVNKLN